MANQAASRNAGTTIWGASAGFVGFVRGRICQRSSFPTMSNRVVVERTRPFIDISTTGCFGSPITTNQIVTQERRGGTITTSVFGGTSTTTGTWHPSARLTVADIVSKYRGWWSRLLAKAVVWLGSTASRDVTTGSGTAIYCPGARGSRCPTTGDGVAGVVAIAGFGTTTW